MDRLHIEYDWLKEVIPEGIRVPSSILISGPGGSGKPLLAGMLLASWLKQNGSVIYFLINSDKDYVQKIFSIYDIDIRDYDDRFYFVDFDPEVEEAIEISKNHLKMNLLNPENWTFAINKAKENIDISKHPPIVFGAALNILFFSLTYREQLFKFFYNLFQNQTNCLFTISNNVFEEKMQKLEEAADNLILTYSGKNLELHLQVIKMKEVDFKKKDIVVPLSEQELRNIRSEAERMRKHLIPTLKKI